MKHNKEKEIKSYDDVIKRLQFIESNIDLRLFNYEDVDLWPLLKSQIAIKCFDRLEKRKDKLGTHWQRVYLKLKLLYKNKLFRTLMDIFFVKEEKFSYEETKYLFLSDEYSKRVPVENLWIDVFIYPFISIKSIADDEYVILRSNQNQSKIKKPFLNEINISSLVLRSFIESKIIFKKNNRNLNLIFNEIKNMFEFDGMNNNFPSFEDLISEAKFIYKLSLKFEKILLKVMPDEVVVTHYLGYVTAGICIASKRLGIKVSDIQHGVQSSLHPAYNFRGYPTKGFTTTPNKYYVWNKNDFNNISLWNDSESIPEIEVIGNPVKYLVEKDERMIKMFISDFKSSFKHHIKKQLVLITLCWSYYISDIFLEVILKADKDTFFLIRFHPSTPEYEKKEVIERLFKLNKNNFEYEKSSELPLHIIFKHIDIHISEVSTAIPEGLEYGIKTIATGNRAKAYYKNLDKYEGLIFSDSSEHISNIIINNRKGRDNF